MDGNDLINTTSLAPFQREMAQASRESWAYAYLAPYPTFAFGATQWPDTKGPRPTPMPYVSTLVAEGAEFVFRNGIPAFSVPDDSEADKFLQRVILRNELAAQYIALAEDNGNQGAMAAKFSVDLNNKECPVRISFLKIPQECRVWFDPHDKNVILMARIQYPYRNVLDGKWYYYREEFTKEWWITYEPLLAGGAEIAGINTIPGYSSHLGDSENPTQWQISTQVENPLGVIPITVLRNKAIGGNPLGEGDCWRAFRLIDRIALTMHGEDISNQLHSRPIPVSTNADLDNEGALLPGEPLSIKNDNPDVRADFKLVEPSGAAREYSVGYVDKMEDLVYRLCGMSRIKLSEVSTKGNMTALAFSMLFARTIATTDRKRQLLGESGFSKLFRNILIGLQNIGGVPSVDGYDPETPVSCEWPTYFAETPQDLKATTERTVTQVQGGLLSHERGAERIAKAEKIPAGEINSVVTDATAARSRMEALAAAEANSTSKQSSVSNVPASSYTPPGNSVD